MKEIPLSQGKVALVDDEDYDWLAQWKWYAKSDLFGHFYAERNLPRNGHRRHEKMHRAIMQAPDGMPVDHRNHNTLDNRRENLRVCTRSQNQMNQVIRSDNTTGYKGVCFNRRDGVFMAYIDAYRKRIYLGTYPSAELAYTARKEAEKKLHGEFSCDEAML